MSYDAHSKVCWGFVLSPEQLKGFSGLREDPHEDEIYCWALDKLSMEQEDAPFDVVSSGSNGSLTYTMIVPDYQADGDEHSPRVVDARVMRGPTPEESQAFTEALAKLGLDGVVPGPLLTTSYY